MLDMLELYHPLAPARLRWCNNIVAVTATLEDTAPADAGEAVEWLGMPTRIVEPDESDSASNPDTVLQVDNVSGGLSDALRITRGSLVPWILTNRKYASDDLSGPAQLPPTVVELRAVEIDSTTARLVFNFGDAGNVGIPALTFNRTEYPGLVR